MTDIYKYPLKVTSVQEIVAPIGKILDIQIQNGVPCLWAIVSDLMEPCVTKIYAAGTGTRDVSANELSLKQYISTTQTGGLVLHWFYEYA